jgi:acyl-CoA thioester hydrolase
MPDSTIPTPYVSERQAVLPDWIDVNGHMNVAFYLRAFDLAFDESYERIGLTAAHRAQAGGSTFAAEMHLTYQRELLEGDPLRITSQLIGFDARRMHWLQCMYHGGAGYLAATAEWLILYVDLGARKAAAMPGHLQRRLAAIAAAHAGLGIPPEVGRRIDFANRPPRMR